MIKFKITRALANKAVRHNATGPTPIEKKPNDDIWNVHICAKILNAEDLKSKKHNKIMPIASKFYKKVRDDIGVKTEQLVISPEIFRSPTDTWICNFNVIIEDNEEETLHYMVWWISSCVGRIYEV
jgi:hypothetical protein